LAAAKPDGHALLAAASVWGLASSAAAADEETSLAAQYADRAAALLIEATEKSFLDVNYQAFNRLAIDPALAAIRQHPSVLELLPSLQKQSRGESADSSSTP
jgi:hypothetical protein